MCRGHASAGCCLDKQLCKGLTKRSCSTTLQPGCSFIIIGSCTAVAVATELINSWSWLERAASRA